MRFRQHFAVSSRPLLFLEHVIPLQYSHPTLVTPGGLLHFIMSKIAHISSQSHLDRILSTTSYVIADFYADWCGPCKVG